MTPCVRRSAPVNACLGGSNEPAIHQSLPTNMNGSPGLALSERRQVLRDRRAHGSRPGALFRETMNPREKRNDQRTGGWPLQKASGCGGERSCAQEVLRKFADPSENRARLPRSIFAGALTQQAVCGETGRPPCASAGVTLSGQLLPGPSRQPRESARSGQGVLHAGAARGDRDTTLREPAGPDARSRRRKSPQSGEQRVRAEALPSSAAPAPLAGPTQFSSRVKWPREHGSRSFFPAASRKHEKKMPGKPRRAPL